MFVSFPGGYIHPSTWKKIFSTLRSERFPLQPQKIHCVEVDSLMSMLGGLHQGVQVLGSTTRESNIPGGSTETEVQPGIIEED